MCSSGWAFAATLPGACLEALVTWKAAAWLPDCLSFVRLPNGQVSHDVWQWLPLALDLLTLVAVAAPLSFRSILSVVPSFLKKGNPS